MQSISLQDLIAPLIRLGRVDLEAYGRTKGQHRAICYSKNAHSDVLHVAFENNSLYELGTSWKDLKKFQVPENDETLPMFFATLPNTIACELVLEQTQSPCSKVIDLADATCLWNMSAIYFTPRQTKPSEGGWESFTSRDQPLSDFEVFRWRKTPGWKHSA